MTTTNPESAHAVEHLFDDIAIRKNRFNRQITAQDLPYLTRPLIELIHDFKPTAVIAADRGARPIGFATIAGWRHRFPNERFPTRTGKIHFARLSNSLYVDEFTRLVTTTLQRSEVLEKNETQASLGARIILIDDWTCHGRTYDRFETATAVHGIYPANIRFYTMFSKALNEQHLVGDTFRFTDDFCQWNDDSDMTGVKFDDNESPLDPIPCTTVLSRILRNTIITATDEYYARFRAATAYQELSRATVVEGQR